jgi:hypothetical protein
LWENRRPSRRTRTFRRPSTRLVERFEDHQSPPIGYCRDREQQQLPIPATSSPDRRRMRIPCQSRACSPGVIRTTGDRPICLRGMWPSRFRLRPMGYAGTSALAAPTEVGRSGLKTRILAPGTGAAEVTLKSEMISDFKATLSAPPRCARRTRPLALQNHAVSVRHDPHACCAVRGPFRLRITGRRSASGPDSHESVDVGRGTRQGSRDAQPRIPSSTS